MRDFLPPLLLLIPLLAAAANGINAFFGGRLLDWRVVQRLTVGAAAIAFAGAQTLFLTVLADPTPTTVVLYEWLNTAGLRVEVALQIDTLSSLMALLVTGFGFVIGRFSINYMHRENGFTRYFAAYALFLFSMLLLVLSDNFVLLFVGWEAVGVCSYLLIGQYMDRPAATKASTEAFVANRVGDAGFIVAILIMIDAFGSVRYLDVFGSLGDVSPSTLTQIALCLLLGAIGKSAQLPLGTWLAKAMEGPTPSSALIHAATMVTAGIYVIVRSHQLFDAAPYALTVVALVGAATALYGAMVGQTVSDIKGLLATSTTTQLGLMFLACGLGAYSVAMFHLVAHAFYKSYLFLTAASILHHLHGRLDPAEVEAQHEVPSAYTTVAMVSGGLVLVPILGHLIGGTEYEAAWGFNAWVLLAAAMLAVATAAHYSYQLTRRAFSPSSDHGQGHTVHAPHDGPCSHHDVEHSSVGHDHVHAAHGSGAEAHGAGGPGLPVGPVLWPLGLVAGAALLGLFAELLPGGLHGTWFQKAMAPVIGASSWGADRMASSLDLALGLLLIAMVVYAWFSALFLTRYRAESALGVLTRHRALYVASLNRFWMDHFLKGVLVRRVLELGQHLDRVDRFGVARLVSWPARWASLAGGLVGWANVQGTEVAERSPKAVAGHVSSVASLVESVLISGLERGLRGLVMQIGRVGSAFEGAIATPMVAVILIAVVTVVALLGVR